MATKPLSFLEITAWLVLAAASAAGTVAHGATLTTSDCARITSDHDRLSCFEKIFPPEKPVADPKKDLHDNTPDEKVGLEKSIKSICKDCLKQSR